MKAPKDVVRIPSRLNFPFLSLDRPDKFEGVVNLFA